MSHIVTIQTKLRDPMAVTMACRRLGLADPVQGSVRLFSAEAAGLIVCLPDWRYPVVVDPSSGDVRYDNFEGQWGDSRQLHRLIQAYAAEKTKLEARKKGWAVQESTLHDGSIQLHLTRPS